LRVLEEFRVIGGERDDRRGHRLGEIAFHERWTQTLLGFDRAQKHDAERGLIDAGRAHLGDFDGLAQQRVRDRAINIGVMRAGFGKNLCEGRRIYRVVVRHEFPLSRQAICFPTQLRQTPSKRELRSAKFRCAARAGFI
jgi:hypothetical protein